MGSGFLTRSRGPRLGLALVLLAVVTISACPGQVAASAREDKVIVLPGATSAEGVAVGRGSTFFAGDLFTGDIFRGDLQRGTAELFIDVSDSRMRQSA